MHMKSSYAVLKWTLMMGVAASLATACVVSSGDGNDNGTDLPEGGDGGTNSSAGTKTTGGGGSSSSGGKAGGSSAGTANGGEPAGGSGNDYVPGLCQAADPTPSMEPSCAPKDKDNDCGACLKSKCCAVWQTCYGDEPTSACGWGSTPTADGQFDCIVNCYAREADGIKSEEEVLGDCDMQCLNQCTDEISVNDDTRDLVACALSGEDEDPDTAGDDCHDLCFPPPM